MICPFDFSHRFQRGQINLSVCLDYILLIRLVKVPLPFRISAFQIAKFHEILFFFLTLRLLTQLFFFSFFILLSLPPWGGFVGEFSFWFSLWLSHKTGVKRSSDFSAGRRTGKTLLIPTVVLINVVDFYFSSVPFVRLLLPSAAAVVQFALNHVLLSSSWKGRNMAKISSSYYSFLTLSSCL